jgi:hypothetical protein
MTWNPIAFLPPQYVDTPGAPYSGAILKAYADGTTNVISMATDNTGATTATSFALNAAGYPVSGGAVIIPHLQENYKLALYPDQASADADSGAIWIVDNIVIAEAANTAFVQTFSGDGSTVEFTLTEDLGTDENTIMVFADISGTKRQIHRPDEYTLANNTLTFDTAPVSGTNNIVVFAPSLLFGAVEGSAAAAATSETNAAASATAAAASATAAATSETNAATSETNAATSATNAATSATNAATSETNAATSATNAATSETNAANSATASAASATEAQTASSMLLYAFASSTTMADPGTGLFRLNNATLSSVTAIAIDATSGQSGNPDVSDRLADWGVGTSTIKGTLTITNGSSPATFVTYSVTAVADNTGWLQFTVAHVDSNGTFSASDNCYLHFTKTGNKGDTGAGDVSGPVSSTDNAIARFDGTGGSDIQNSGVTIDDNNLLTAPGGFAHNKGEDIASAGTMVIDTDGGYFDVTGTTTITGFTVAAKREFTLQFDGALTLTHGASLVLPGAANITTAAGDIGVFYATAADTVVCVSYTKADGTSVVGGAGGQHPGYTTGKYYASALIGDNSGSASLSANSLRTQLFILEEDATFDRVEVRCESTTSLNARLGIYSVGSDGLPDSLIEDFGTFASSSTGAKSITISTSLSKGMYYLAMVTDATANWRSTQNSTENSRMHYIGVGDSGSGAEIGKTQSFTYGALPASFTGTSSNSQMPVIWLRKA